MFSAAKVTQVPLLSASHAALLSWSVSPTLARYGFYTLIIFKFLETILL
jgi:hypothetical protein